MTLHESGEMYLGTIYRISLIKSEVRSVQVAESLGVTKPSVSRAISTLKEAGYLTMDKDRFIHLTDKGLEVAKKIYNRNNMLVKFLNLVGVPEEIALIDACKMEHAISDTTYDAMKTYFNF